MLNRLVANRSGKVRHDKMEGRDYLVVPMVMLTEGVHEGNQGPLYYPAAELKKTPQVWNHKPVVVYHPVSAEGVGISACDPEVITNRKVGVIMNTKYKAGKLHAEAWLEESRLKAIDKRVLNSIENDEIMELSTGLFTENEDEPGEWNGEEYDAVARNYKPDHLAILPDKVGACSIADGAGFLRLNEANPAAQAALQHATTDAMARLVGNDKSFGSISSELYGLVQAKYGDQAWVSDVYEDFCIYCREGKCYKLEYEVDDDTGKVVIPADAKPVEVVRVTEYRTVDGAYVGNAANQPQQEVKPMTKREKVNHLIANGGWETDDRGFLMGLPTDKLDKMIANTGIKEEPKEGEEAAPGETKSGEGGTRDTTGPTRAAPNTGTTPAPANTGTTVAPTPPAQNQKAPTVEEYINNAPPELRDSLRAGHAQAVARRTTLVATITANGANRFPKEKLEAMPLQDLEDLAVLATPAQAQGNTAPVANYAGMAPTPAPVANAGAAKEEPLELPAWKA